MMFWRDCSERFGMMFSCRERVAGDRDEREDEEARRDEDDDAVEQPANDVAQHVPTPRMLEVSPATAGERERD